MTLIGKWIECCAFFYLALSLESQVVPPDWFLFHFCINTCDGRALGKIGKCLLPTFLSWHTEIINGSNKIKWKSRNDCFSIGCANAWRLESVFFPIAFVFRTWKNSIFILCVCCACVVLAEDFSFAAAHQQFSFSFYVIWFPIDNQRVIDTYKFQCAKSIPTKRKRNGKAIFILYL